MAKLTKIQQAQFDSLAAQVAALTTQVGILMNSLEASNQVRVDLQDERDALIAENEQLIIILSSQAQTSAPVAKSAPRMTIASTVVESQAPIVSITDADKAIWSKFQRLSREERMTIINWARPIYGHVGINNIIEIRAAWHEYQCQDDIAMAAIDYDFDEQYQAVQDVADLQAS